MTSTFPTVEGSSLSKTRHRLPETLEHEVNLLMIAFQQRQQGDVESWVPLAGDLAAEFDGFGAYELPVIPRGYRPFAGFIDGGMRAGIPDPAVRAATITLYIDRNTFMQSLEIPDTESIVPMLVRPSGEILWRTTGRFRQDAGDELRAAVEGVH
ncbi:MAG: hypothetical protein QNJ71_11090 [Acidimicrobiia bacterium]|nr:hypothetical protein [Acidimicrobiia bacterium]